jgi:hypothetical protein
MKTKTMITMSKFSLVKKTSVLFGELNWDDTYAVKLKYTYFPIGNYGNNGPAWFDGIPEGLYLTGLEVISSKWVNKGYCALLFAHYGLVIDEARPMLGIDNERYPLIYISFVHVTQQLYGKLKIDSVL